MSTIVAVEKDGRVALATDTLVTVGSTASPNAITLPKVVRADSALIGTAGLSVYYSLLREFFAGEERGGFTDEAEILRAFVAFWNFMREEYHFVNDQSADDDTTPFVDMEAEFIVASASGLFHVREILSVTRHQRFCAIGSGAGHAEGAASVLYEQNLSAQDIAHAAVDVAMKFDRASGGEVIVYELQER